MLNESGSYQKSGDFTRDPIDRERQADIKSMLQDAIKETVYLQKIGPFGPELIWHLG